MRFRPPARLCVRGLEFHPRAVAASSTRRSPPGDLAPSRRIGPERSLRPTGAPSRAGQIVPGFALDAPVGEDMAQAQVVGQIKQRRLMSQVGPHAFVPPTSDGEGVGSETAGDLRPRQAGLHLEPLQALWEVVGENVGHSAVVCALSRNPARPPSRRTGHSLHRERAGCHVIPGGRDKSKRECLSADAPVCGLFCVQEGGASSPGAALLVTYGATAR